MKFERPESQIDFPNLEESILSHWKQEDVFRKSIDQRSEDELWTFYDGPPFATGLPHYGHLLAGTIKDVIPRFWAMKGKRVERRFGWDCHGLPVEFEIEKKLELKGRADILDYGVKEFNDACRGIVMRYAKDWEKIVDRSGRWVDFDQGYKTMDLPFMESVWAVFKQLWEKGLIYEDKKVLPYSTRVTSPLSNFEANLNYQDVQDPSVYVLFKDKKNARNFLVWTTTPWTLPSNMALAVHPELDYVEFSLPDQAEHLVAAKSLLKQILGKKNLKLDAISIQKEFKGKELVGTAYDQLIPFHQNEISENDLKIYAAEYVSADSGTGIVHIAPAYGEEDFNVGKEHKLTVADHLDEQGYFNSDSPLWAKQYFKDADKEITAFLKENKQLFHQETLQHAYPYCYRSDTPLIYRAVSTWFVRVSAFQDKLIKNNQQVRWVPEHLKDGRFGKWLENARDWAISRNRFWGNPIPIWRDEESGETLCVGSCSELEKLTGKKPTDLHKHVVDELEIVSPKTGKILKRVPQVLDCWFESGSMPYGQMHYPFSMSDEDFEKRFPADFIAEGLDQTRGWFYTLMVLATALKDQPAFKNVVVNGIVLASDGRKMSKRLKNYPEPMKLIDKYGADAMRLYLLNSGAVSGEDLKFDEEGVNEVVRKLFLPFWNAYSFLATYAHIDGWDPETDMKGDSSDELDQWIQVKLKRASLEIHEALESYQLSQAVGPLYTFLDDLNNWYIRRSRRRFWKSDTDREKVEAFGTLFQVLCEYTKLLAPFAPFISDGMYQRLNFKVADHAKVSVHLEDFPSPTKLSPDERELEKKIDFARDLVSMGRELREKLKIKVRQPLSKMFVGVLPSESKLSLESIQDVVLEELNVKEVVLCPFPEMASWEVKPNYKEVGKKLGAKMKSFQTACRDLNEENRKKLLQGLSVTLDGELYPPEYFEMRLQASKSFQHPCHAAGDKVIAFDVELSEELLHEGLAREVISRIQKARKDIGFQVEDRLEIQLQTDSDDLQTAVKAFLPRIEAETLSTLSVQNEEPEKAEGKTSQTLDFEKYHVKAWLEKVKT